ncbi:pyridoxamine 5'-phosphate oxidase [Salegentibacter chungangensis]|uniref:Pyridoxine/pyridoxamine 5'-phosphate oxidase n=1 Tax=Salegentibacter chungangensis TaxID=1335724 RepID=A0ABW3NVI5_9FLAO
MQKDLQDYRKSYEQSELLEDRIPNHPTALFAAWFEEAESHPGIAEVNAMTLSTVGEDNFPQARIVLLKSFDKEGFVFYTNYNSEKARAIEKHKEVCLTFFWPSLERQVIIKGKATKNSEEEATDYFKTRPRGSQLGAWASNQSSPVASRAEIEERLKYFEDKFEGQEVPKPAHWGGYRVKAKSFEFWQGRVNRLHDRILYEVESEKNWNVKRLAP